METIKYTYGEFTQRQMSETKEKMRKQVFFLLLIVDPNTAGSYDGVCVDDAFKNVLHIFGGLNDLLGYQREFVDVMSLLNAAYIEYRNDNFNWQTYRKLILDAGNAVLKIKEVDNAEP